MTQTYKYIVNDSIVGTGNDEYTLSQEEYALIYSFYVTYSMCGKQSLKRRTFMDYGWESNNIQVVDNHKKRNTDLGNALIRVIDFSKLSTFIFTDKDDLKKQFSNNNLEDGILTDYDVERCVIGQTSESNKYLKLFYRIRDGFAHGKFLLKKSSANEKMVIIQDDNGKNVTARIVIKLSTLLQFVSCIDLNKTINFDVLAQEDVNPPQIHVA